MSVANLPGSEWRWFAMVVRSAAIIVSRRVDGRSGGPHRIEEPDVATVEAVEVADGEHDRRIAVPARRQAAIDAHT